jgi:uncharacterized membrane protein
MSISFVLVSIAMDNPENSFNNVVLDLLEISILYMVSFVFLNHHFLDNEDILENFKKEYIESSHSGMMLALITTYIIIIIHALWKRKTNG